MQYGAPKGHLAKSTDNVNISKYIQRAPINERPCSGSLTKFRSSRGMSFSARLVSLIYILGRGVNKRTPNNAYPPTPQIGAVEAISEVPGA